MAVCDQDCRCRRCRRALLLLLVVLLWKRQEAEKARDGCEGVKVTESWCLVHSKVQMFGVFKAAEVNGHCLQVQAGLQSTGGPSAGGLLLLRTVTHYSPRTQDGGEGRL